MIAILSTYAWASRKKSKGYALVSQAKMLKLEEEHYGVKHSRSSLNNYQGEMRQQGYIEQQRRTKFLGPKGYRFATTLTVVTKKGWRFLYFFGSSMSRAGVRVFAALNKALQPSPSGRCPVDVSGLPSRDPDFLPRIREFIKSIS
jgi:hypothetical protein